MPTRDIPAGQTEKKFERMAQKRHHGQGKTQQTAEFLGKSPQQIDQLKTVYHGVYLWKPEKVVWSDPRPLSLPCQGTSASAAELYSVQLEERFVFSPHIGELRLKFGKKRKKVKKYRKYREKSRTPD
jgi:hypothetical protein